MTNLLFLAFCFPMYFLITADTDLPHDQSVFLNRTATFTFCPPSSPTSYTINGSKSHLLPEDFKRHIRFTSNSSFCHFLSFPAWSEYDGAQIQFQWGLNGSSRTAVLHIQGVLGPPGNLRNMRTNSTHDSLVWDNPQSLLGHENTTYQVELSSRDLKVTESVSVGVSSYIYLRLAALAMASVTAWNPVGEGEMSTLNLSESLNGCKTIDDITPFALPYFDNGSIVVLLKWEIHVRRTEVYCFDYITVMPTWRGPTRHIPTIEDNMAVIRLHNVPKESHHQVVVQLGTFQHNLSFSTYAVQDVESTEDHVMLTCTFLKGVMTQTCFVVVMVNDLPSHNLSDSKSYTLNITGGHYTLMVYDNKLQAESGVEPAERINFVIPVNEENDNDKSSNELGIGIGVGVGLLLLILFVVHVGIGVLVLAVFIRKQYNPPTSRNDVQFPEDNDGPAQYVCSQQPTAAIPRNKIETGHTSQTEVDRGNSFQTGHTRQSPARLPRVNAVHRNECKSDSDTGYSVPVDIIDQPSRAEESCDEVTINRAEEDKEAQLLDGLKETILCLHLKPVQPTSS